MRGKERDLFPPWCLPGSRGEPALAALPSASSTLLPSTPLTPPLRLDHHAFSSRGAFSSRRSRGGTVSRSCRSPASMAIPGPLSPAPPRALPPPVSSQNCHGIRGRYGRIPFFRSVGGCRPASAGGRAPGGADPGASRVGGRAGAGSKRRVTVCTCSGRAWTAVSSGSSR
jgi:hypothetical protein